jgi:hypothetical protein
MKICLECRAMGDSLIAGGAGQALVQMAKGKHDRQEYAIKFFLTQNGFDAEHEMYRSGSDAQVSDLAQFLPKVCRIPSPPTYAAYLYRSVFP